MEIREQSHGDVSLISVQNYSEHGSDNEQPDQRGAKEKSSSGPRNREEQASQANNSKEGISPLVTESPLLPESQVNFGSQKRISQQQQLI